MSKDKTETRQSEDEARDSIRCPDCGCAHSGVLYTRHALGSIRRRRECRHCGRRFTTTERKPE